MIYQPVLENIRFKVEFNLIALMHVTANICVFL